MLGSDVVVVQGPSLFDCILDNLLGSRRLGELAHCHHIRAALDQLFNLEPKLLDINVKILQNRCADSAALLNKPEQDMFSSYIFMIEPLGLLVRQRHYLACTICEAFKHL